MCSISDIGVMNHLPDMKITWMFPSLCCVFFPSSLDRKNNIHYLIKWRELAYDQATWEADDMDVPDFDTCKVQYWHHRWDTDTGQTAAAWSRYIYTLKPTPLLTMCVCFRELMMGDEGKPGKKIKVKGRVKRPDRPPENPVIDVSISMFPFLF